ncbi:MAG TPA: MBL fold metallo-hydrolase [Gaiellaceae bacterium]|nr:MBL fold metallo-hydrolase [Gaiellaceae bacterium]
MRLTVVGSSPAWPNPGGAQSGYLVEDGGGRLLLDCGPGVVGRLRSMDGHWPHVDAVVITHWHLDHWGDLVPWVWGSMNGPGRGTERTELWLPPDGRDRLQDFGSRLGWDAMFDETFVIHDYEGGEPFEAAGFTVTPFRLPHYTLLTFGLRVTNGSRSLAYSGDCGPDGQLAELAREVDLFVCEATLESAECDGTPRGHLSADEAVAAFEASGAHRLLLTHRPGELPVADGLELAHDGLVVELG